MKSIFSLCLALALLSASISAAEIKTVQSWKTDEYEMAASHIAYKAENASPLVIVGLTKPEKTFMTVAKWQSDTLTFVRSAVLDFPDYGKCSHPTAGHLESSTYNNFFFVAAICKESTTSKNHILVAKVNEEGDVVAWTNLVHDNFNTDLEDFDMWLEAMNTEIVVAYVDKDGDSAFVTFDADLNKGVSLYTPTVIMNALSHTIGTNKILIAGDYQINNESLKKVYLSEFQENYSDFNDGYFNIEGALATAIKANSTRAMLCVTIADDASGDVDVKGSGAVFFQWSNSSVLGYSLLKLDEDGEVNCTMSSDATKFYQTLGNFESPLLTWGYGSDYKISEKFEVGTKPSGRKIVTSGLVADSTASTLFYSYFASKSNAFEAGIAVVSTSGTDSDLEEFSESEATVTNPTFTEISGSIWTRNDNAGEHTAVRKTTDIASEIQITTTTLDTAAGSSLLFASSIISFVLLALF